MGGHTGIAVESGKGLNGFGRQGGKEDRLLIIRAPGHGVHTEILPKLIKQFAQIKAILKFYQNDPGSDRVLPSTDFCVNTRNLELVMNGQQFESGFLFKFRLIFKKRSD